MNHTPLTVLPPDIAATFGAEVFSATPTAKGCYRLVDIRRTLGSSYQGQRITVLVVDENGQGIAGVPVAFSFSTADRFTLTSDFAWIPPQPHRAFIARTEGGGQIDQIQGSVVKDGQPGGVTVYILDPAHSSDIVTGCGMLANHDGLFLQFQLLRAGVIPLDDRLGNIEARLSALERGQVGDAA